MLKLLARSQAQQDGAVEAGDIPEEYLEEDETTTGVRERGGC